MDKKKRYLFFWLYTFLAVGVPAILIAQTYGFLEKNTSLYQIGTGFILVCVILLFYFRKHIGEMVVNMEPSMLKHLLTAVKELMPLIIIYFVFAVTTFQFENITFILKWSCISNAFALGFRALHLKEVENNKQEGSE